MEMHDLKTIEYKGKPLFQSAKMISPGRLQSSFEQVACFIYITKGKGQVIESNGSHVINRQEAIVKSCGNFISDYLKDEDGNDFEATVIYFYPEFLREIYEDIIPETLTLDRPQAPKKIVSNEFVSKYIDGLNLYFENSDMMDDTLMRHKMKELIIILLRSNFFEGVAELFVNLFSPRQQSFRDIVSNNIFSQVSVDELAFLAHRSLSTFKRDFRKEFNDTPARYIKKKRLEKSAEMLLSTKDSISTVAFDCGFQDLSTFSSVFRDFYGLSPTEYRLNGIRKSLD